MKERDVLKAVTDMLDLTGWKWWHVPAPMLAGRDGNWHPARNAKGLPDIFALHEDPPRMLILELKGDRGSLTDEQREFLRLAQNVATTIRTDYHDLVCAGAHAARPQDRIGVYVVTPDNLGTLEQMLISKVLV